MIRQEIIDKWIKNRFTCLKRCQDCNRSVTKRHYEILTAIYGDIEFFTREPATSYGLYLGEAEYHFHNAFCCCVALKQTFLLLAEDMLEDTIIKLKELEEINKELEERLLYAPPGLKYLEAKASFDYETKR